ncbi:MAG: DMT family transporter, partial [Deltaproteobacteria bacterium]|nr:DMT family transporter [Deltaproteobacteria bacterium]
MRKKIINFLGPGPASMILAGLCFSLMAALVKKLNNDFVPISQIVFFRAGVSSLILLSFMLPKGIPLLGRHPKLLLLRSLSGFTAMVLNFYALKKIPLGDAAVLQQSTPLFVLLLSVVFLKETFLKNLLFWILLSLIGILLVLRPSGEIFNLGGLAALSGAFLASVAYVSIRQLHKTDSALTMAFYFMAVASLLSLGPALWFWVQPTPLQLLQLIGAGLLGTGGQLLLTYAYKHDQ